MLFIRNDIPAKVFSTDDRSTESFYELNFRKEKWLLTCSNNPNPVDTGRKLNVHKTFRRRPGRLMYVQNTSCVYWEAQQYRITSGLSFQAYRLTIMLNTTISILLADFNSRVEDSPLKTFGAIYKLRNLIKEPTWFQNPDNPTCTDLTLANKPLNFKSIYVIETAF